MLQLLRLVSLRHLFGSPLRTVLTILGVAVGVATMVGIASINRTVLDAFRSTVDTIAGKADLTITASSAGFDDSLVDTVRNVPGVTHASGALTAIAPVAGHPGESLYVIGADLLDDGYFRSYQAVDRDIGTFAEDLEFLNTTELMLVSERFAEKHHLKVGDSFKLDTRDGVKDFKVHALIRESGPARAFGGSVALMYIGAAQEAFGRGRNIDRIDVAIDPTVGIEQMKTRLRQAVGGGFEIERPSQRGGSVEKMVRSFQLGLNIASGVALLVGVFLVYNTIAIGVLQRRREIGTLRAIGGTRTRLRLMFTLEAMVFGVTGTLIGLPFGVVVAKLAIHEVSKAISSLYVQVNASQVNVGPLEITVGILLGVLGSMFAALRPAWTASQVQPVEALRRDISAGADRVALKASPTLVAGLFLVSIWPLSKLPAPVENFPVGGYLAMFATLMGATLLTPLILRELQPLFARPGQWLLGISGRIAAENFARAPARTAVPVAALSIGVAMTVCIAGFVGSFRVSALKWIDESVPADLFVTSSAKLGGIKNTPMSEDVGQEIQTIDGIESVDFVRLFQHDVLDLRCYILSMRPDVYYRHSRPAVLEGSLPTAEERAQGRVIISENLSRRRNLHPGDQFPLDTPTGTHRLTVGAVIIDYTSDQGALYLDREDFIRFFKDRRVDTFEIYLKDIHSLDQVRQAITAKLGASHDLYVLTNNELRDEALGMVEAAFSITYAMEAVAVLLALLGVINTLLAAVLDRTREIGLLRAIGAARGHVIRLFTAEAAFIGISGGLIGVVSGSVMSLIITRVVGVQATGWSFPFVFPTAIALQMIAAASVCAILAGLYPARRAARLDVVEALAYE